ncbi:conserved exported hypothetical protein [Candidatus Nitrotoga sp. HW29]|uniref:hypothetical protein n=1 Tax=Candidatus Nitrotoga sp. HW29 TaxID=2886963 RepID=UPI001EF2296C|nr:hypothetical protein [Candidatus Nitrotoga sp. HW29]CAH1905343.1 conserved exported hypothetical protein [Candidatus Nitrotoga sp. HW29]
MKKLVIVVLLSMFAVNLTFATDNSCDNQATEKKLAGAAKNSFLKKCNKDAALTACGIQATEKKLAGAAKNSFLKKCEKDATAK